MIQVDMSASTRENFGKGAMRRLRVSGNTPAVLYGNDKNVMALQLETASFLKTLFQISRKNALVNLSINGSDTRHVMMKEIQTDPVDDSLIHADFFEINLQTPKCFTVALELEGKAKGEDLGGKLIVYSSLVEVEGLPLDIPDVITLDVSDLDIRDTVKVADIKLPENITMITDGSGLCVEVISARAAAAADAAALAAADAAAIADEEQSEEPATEDTDEAAEAPAESES